MATIVRNESAQLPGLLASIAEFRSLGGEVVVLDTGSSDDTAQIAREAGCVVAPEPRRFNRALTEKQAITINKTFSKGGEGPFVLVGARVFDIAAARNAVDALAANVYVLAVDASDRIEVFDLAFVDRQVRANAADVLMFETRRLHRGRWVLEQRGYLHDRRTTVWAGRAHNFVAPLSPERQPKGALLPRDRLRVIHQTEPTRDRGYQLTGLALDVLASPSSSHRRLLLGNELAARGYYQSALALFLDLDRSDVKASIRSSALSMAAPCLAASGAGSDEGVAELLFKASRRDPSHRHPLLQLARLSLSGGDFQAAASLASAALAIPSRVTFTESEENLRGGPHAILYWALFWLGRKTEALEHFRVCLELDPRNTIYLDHTRLFSP